MTERSTRRSAGAIMYLPQTSDGPLPACWPPPAAAAAPCVAPAAAVLPMTQVPVMV